ncbi:MAG: shikimate dehydrogenase [Desulfobulbaceae bacterium]|uniref:Shikimate dehydrogenase (NADP(+)) n=1 Tax=Candidatus Desulfatifera sulfidica TaxID=2841691 RepID=A0A8J6TDS2_9BACT|nr:shikimate dehydrogenase [Candidatus Desulfatifera sulfidica]
MTITGGTSLYGIVGNPVRHSLSPVMHNAAFQALGLNCVYVPLPTEDVAAAMTGLRALGIQGVSVTIPHKEAVISLLDEVDPLAMSIGAVNTIKAVEQKGRVALLGSNTDWQGANQALLAVTDLAGKKVIILGAGGSARAIGFGLQQEGAQVILCSRTKSRGQSLAADLGCTWISLEQSQELAGDVLVNATSVGMNDPQLSPVDASILDRFSVVMDIVYAPLITRLLQEAESAGCLVVNGLEMLLYQGVAQFELWTGQSAPVPVMRRALYQATGNMYK